MPTPPNDAPPMAFGNYLVRRLSRPIEATALGAVYLLFLLVGGWIPLWAGHALATRTIDLACRLVGMTWLARGPAAHIAGLAFPNVLLFLGMLRCDHDRLVRAWHASTAASRSVV